MSDTLKVGDMAPDFELMNQDRTKIHLADYRGKKKVALLFYPMDFSPICTQEHCSFGPALDQIQKDDQTVVFGVSCDSPFSHEAFRKQYSIPYDLLADPTRKMVKAYGMWAGEEPFNCSKRGTIVIGKDGRVTFAQVNNITDVRKVDAIAQAVEIDELLQNRADEFGSNAG